LNKYPEAELARYLLLWSWRESNPRPNKKQKGFLHVYPIIGFRN